MWIVLLFLSPWQALPVFQGWRPFRMPDYLTSFMSSHRLTPDPNAHGWNPHLIHLAVFLSPQFYTQPDFFLPSLKILSYLSGVSSFSWPSCAMDNVPCAMDNVPSCSFVQLCLVKFVGSQGSPREEIETLLSLALLSRKWEGFTLVTGIYLCFNQQSHTQVGTDSLQELLWFQVSWHIQEAMNPEQKCGETRDTQ